MGLVFRALQVARCVLSAKGLILEAITPIPSTAGYERLCKRQFLTTKNFVSVTDAALMGNARIGYTGSRTEPLALSECRAGPTSIIEGMPRLFAIRFTGVRRARERPKHSTCPQTQRPINTCMHSGRPFSSENSGSSCSMTLNRHPISIGGRNAYISKANLPCLSLFGNEVKS